MGQLSDGMAALIRYANEATGASDSTLSEAVETLCEGYGGGGGEIPHIEYEWAELEPACHLQSMVEPLPYKVEVKFCYAENGLDDVSIFGAFENSGRQCLYLTWYQGVWYFSGQNGQLTCEGDYPYNEPTTIIMNDEQGRFIQDGQVKLQYTVPQPREQPYRDLCGIFSRWIGGASRTASHAKLWYIKFYNRTTGELIHHLVPASIQLELRTVDGLYDKITGIFSAIYDSKSYTNKGAVIQ